MINHLHNTTLSMTKTTTRANLKQTSVRNESLEDKHKTKEAAKASESKLESIKEAIKNGTYPINVKGSAEKLAQELLG